MLSPGQRQTAESLRRIIHLATGNTRQFLPLATRTNTLIAGQSGTGKSHLVRTLAAEARLPLWETNVANWIVLGARYGEPTLQSLSAWIAEHHAGIIFLDEIEKISDANPWYNSIGLEIHSICDGLIPESVVPDIDDFDALGFGDLSAVRRKSMLKAELETKLRHSFIVIAAGAWQQEWSRPSKMIGFRTSSTKACGLDRKQLLKMISPEILQRFRHDVLFLEAMEHGDYLEVMEVQSSLLPDKQRARFAELVVRSIPRAIEDGLGMRIFEEVYTDLCMEMMPDVANHSADKILAP